MVICRRSLVVITRWGSEPRDRRETGGVVGAPNDSLALANPYDPRGMTVITDEIFIANVGT